ncbi:RNA polymerase II subunit A C-terminal domain phosphatase SSU72 [Herpailurus yagouaroundi]|nr:RNA polymerase II subunit A C-terminal domain phosphatase SSU72 [Puma yagouaroundi]
MSVPCPEAHKFLQWRRLRFFSLVKLLFIRHPSGTRDVVYSCGAQTPPCNWVETLCLPSGWASSRFAQYAAGLLTVCACDAKSYRCKSVFCSISSHSVSHVISLSLRGLCLNPTVISFSLSVSFSKRGFSVRSFGTGTHVKLPGPAPDKPNVYDFKTTYDQMYNDLLRKDKELYTQNGILHMLDRNKRIKPRPERFQNCRDLFDLILTCEERVYDQVVEDLNSREQETCQPVHVINVDIQDNHEEATLGAFLICELCQCIQHTEDMENEIDELLQEFEEKSGRAFLHTVCFY